MSKILVTNNTGASQTLSDAKNTKIKIYDSENDIVLNDLNANEIIATKAEHGEAGSSSSISNVVQPGDMNPVTSNAVYDRLHSIVIPSVTDSITDGSSAALSAKGGKYVDDNIVTKARLFSKFRDGCMFSKLPSTTSEIITYGVTVPSSGDYCFLIAAGMAASGMNGRGTVMFMYSSSNNYAVSCVNRDNNNYSASCVLTSDRHFRLNAQSYQYFENFYFVMRIL